MRARSAGPSSPRASRVVADPLTDVTGNNGQTPPCPPIPAKSVAEFVALYCSREETGLLKPIALLPSLRLIGPQRAPLDRSAHLLVPSVSFSSDPLADIS